MLLQLLQLAGGGSMAPGMESHRRVHAWHVHVPSTCRSSPSLQELLCPQGEADATWVFMGWEGVEARRKGVELNAFK